MTILESAQISGKLLYFSSVMIVLKRLRMPSPVLLLRFYSNVDSIAFGCFQIDMDGFGPVAAGSR